MVFKDFKLKVQEQFTAMVESDSKLFLTDVAKDDLWDKYLDSYPEGTNNIFRERREYDCNTCKQFIRPYGNVVTIQDGKLVSIWDIEIGGHYQVVADALATFVKSAAIRDVFVSKFANLGTDKNYEKREDETVVNTWEHFFFKLPKELVDKSAYSVEAIQGTKRDVKQVFKRALDEITLDSIETTLELIAQNSLYRGEEHQGTVAAFLKYKEEYKNLPEDEKDNYCWTKVNANPAATKIRNTSIGTLLVDISEGKDLDHAVTAFEKIMAPANYKRPNALITKKMIEDAQKTIEELGFTDSLGRRFAVPEDITVNNVLFANRDARKAMNVFEEMAGEVKTDPKAFSKVEEVGIEDFVKNILPKATKLEIMPENNHMSNLVSLIAPINVGAPSMLKWNNNFGWAYNGDVTDSIKEKVKAAGGRVEGELRASLSWYNLDDLDIHAIEPNGNEIYYSHKLSHVSRGQLDVDMNAGSGQTREAVENIIWPDKSRMLEGKYKIIVHNFAKRETNHPGFEIEIEHGGKLYNYVYDNPVRDQEFITVAEFNYSRKDGIKFLTSIESKTSSKEIWGINTNTFVPVSMVLFSPNHWDEQGIGNRHYMFMLEGCTNPNTPRGFFNEFLKADLMAQKRVFEALGAKMKVAPSDRQMSGLGFSSTQRNQVVCKVEGAVSRAVKINF